MRDTQALLDRRRRWMHLAFWRNEPLPSPPRTAKLIGTARRWPSPPLPHRVRPRSRINTTPADVTYVNAH